MGIDYIWAGVFGQGMGGWMLSGLFHQGRLGPTLAGIVVFVLGTAVLAGGFGKYAIYHHRTRWWGLLSILSLLGVMILFALSFAPNRGPGARGGFEVLYAPNGPTKDIWKMNVRIRVDESLGAGTWEPFHMTLPRGMSVLLASKTLVNAVPALRDALDTATFLVNGREVRPIEDLDDGDEVVITKSPPGGEGHAPT